MPRPYVSGLVDARPEQVWALAREFNGLPSWHSGVAESTLVSGAEGQVGAVRHLRLGGDGGELDEELVALDDLARTLTYRIVGDNPFGVRRYVATLRVAPLTMTGQTLVEWWSEYDADGAAEEQLTATFSQAIYETGIRDLQQRLG